jgi:hypothetical protein
MVLVGQRDRQVLGLEEPCTLPGCFSCTCNVTYFTQHTSQFTYYYRHVDVLAYFNGESFGTGGYMLLGARDMRTRASICCHLRSRFSPIAVRARVPFTINLKVRTRA